MYPGKRQRQDDKEGEGASKKSKPFPTRHPYVNVGQMVRKSVMTWKARSLVGHPVLSGRMLDALKYGLIGEIIVPHGSHVPRRVLDLLSEAYTRQYSEDFSDDPHKKLPLRCEAPRLHSFANYVSSLQDASLDKLRDYMFSPFILIANIVYMKRNSDKQEWKDRCDRLAQANFTFDDLKAVMNCIRPKIDGTVHKWRKSELNAAWQYLEHGTCVVQMSVLLTDEIWRLRDISTTENLEGAKFFLWMFLRKNFINEVSEIPEQCMIWARVQPAAEEGYEYILGFHDNMKLLRGDDGQVVDINEEVDNVPDVEHNVDFSDDGDNGIDEHADDPEIKDAEQDLHDLDGTSRDKAAAVASGTTAQIARFIKSKTKESALEADEDTIPSSDRPTCSEHLDLQVQLQPEDTGSLSTVFVPVADQPLDRPTIDVEKTVKVVRSNKKVAYTIAPVKGATIEQQTNALLPMSASSSAGTVRERASAPVAPFDPDSPPPDFEHGQLVLANYNGWPKWPAVVLSKSVDEEGKPELTVYNLGSNDESLLFATEAEAYDRNIAVESSKAMTLSRDMGTMFAAALKRADQYGKTKTEARGRPSKLSMRLAEFEANLAENQAVNALHVAKNKKEIVKTRGRGRPKKS